MLLVISDRDASGFNGLVGRDSFLLSGLGFGFVPGMKDSFKRYGNAALFFRFLPGRWWEFPISRQSRVTESFCQEIKDLASATSRGFFFGGTPGDTPQTAALGHQALPRHAWLAKVILTRAWQTAN